LLLCTLNSVQIADVPTMMVENGVSLNGEPRRKSKLQGWVVFGLLLAGVVIGVVVAVVMNLPHRGQDKPFKKGTIQLATPVASFHNATLQVYKKVLEDRGYKVNAITAINHAEMYPFFTGAHGKKPYVDMVVSSDLPNNHAPWLKNYTDAYDVVGTCYELLSIFLSAPSYTGITSLSEAAKSKDVDKKIIGFDIDPCARCPDLANEWIAKRLKGFTYTAMSMKELKAALTEKIAAKTSFLTTMWAPTYWNAIFPALKKLDMEEFEPSLFNQGKALIRKAAKDKFDSKTLSVLSAVFLGTDTINKLDLSVYKKQQAGSNNAPEEAALEWIAANRNTYDMFFW